MIRVEAQITGCQCTCRHCLTYGCKSESDMSLYDIEFILRNMKDYSHEGFFFPLFDVTNHPEFVNVLQLSHDYDFKRTILSTNGIHDFSIQEFDAMKRMGINEFQIAFHGIGKTHDCFVDRQDAFKNLLSLIEKAGNYGFRFWIMLFIHKQNVSEIRELYQYLNEIPYIKSDDLGICTYQYIGRAMLLKNLQFTRNEFERIDYKDRIMPKRRFTEEEWLDIVNTEEEWNKPVFAYDEDYLDLYIDKDFNVFFREYNPYYLPGLREAKLNLSLGNIKNQPLSEIIENTGYERPKYIKKLESINIKEMAKLVGVKENILYTFNDVPQYKWVHDFLSKVNGNRQIKRWIVP